ncbi:unnamed protein product [Hermetia illucens]|uniref:Cap-specific mRNA (nucleoside-2'-O-)-methyltransferase 2 n=1 Tax=Hermetia illucens TaxID=343691 RepID=A0A7R8YKU0_HERIL|nr:cap-specific mRNA (nucleoside-2'-O-)-methyltransferase 2 [Hermetia illucens]CAD7076890.1 unnamed protein product [Hermetia illucens]
MSSPCSPASFADESHALPKSFYPMLKKLLGNLFDKNFAFEKAESWKLPASNHYFAEDYKIDSLQVLKGKLNAVKSKLNDVQIEEWSAHTRRRNPSGEVAWRLKNAIEAEFVTQAWCKFFECLNRFPIVLGPRLNSIHLCEAPGAFIAALNHYLRSNYRAVEWKWLATTLNPYYEGNPLANMVIDDRFMLHTLENWIFGKDFTGDIMNKENIQDMALKATQLGDINLITADGSIDCMETPECQEEVVSSLHYAETCAALHMLSPGGSFILKMFTLFEATSAALLYLLNCLFDRVNLFKPATSKSGNSEVYVVCVGFRDDDCNFPAVLAAMMDHLQSPQHWPIFAYHALPADFLSQLENGARFFMHQQIMVIHRNIATYRNPGRADGKRCKLIRTHVTNHYLNMYNVRKIRDDEKILHPRHASVQYYQHSRIYTGSFTERQSLGCKSVGEKLAAFRSDLESLEAKLAWTYTTDSVPVEQNNYEIQIYRGKPVEQVYSSLFLNILLMHLMNKILKAAPNHGNMPFHVSMDSNEIQFETKEISLRKNFGSIERQFFKELIDNLVELQPQSVLIRGFPFLTHFSMSFLCLLTNVFEKTTFDSSRTITLERIQTKGREHLTRVKDVFEENNQIDFALCLMDIKELHSDPISEVATNYNNQNCLQYCRLLIEKST